MKITEKEVFDKIIEKEINIKAVNVGGFEVRPSNIYYLDFERDNYGVFNLFPTNEIYKLQFNELLKDSVNFFYNYNISNKLNYCGQKMQSLLERMYKKLNTNKVLTSNQKGIINQMIGCYVLYRIDRDKLRACINFARQLHEKNINFYEPRKVNVIVESGNKEGCLEYSSFCESIDYKPEVDIRKGHINSVFYVDKNNFKFDNKEGVIEYLNKCQELYNSAEDIYVLNEDYKGKYTYNKEYDEDSYISYHFNNIPMKFREDSSFFLYFFNENIFDSHDNLFYCSNDMYFDLQKIQPLITLINSRDYFDEDFYDNLFDIVLYKDRLLKNELKCMNFNDNELDKDELLYELNKYKIEEMKEKFEIKFPPKGIKEKKGKI